MSTMYLDVVNVKYQESRTAFYTAVAIARLKPSDTDERMDDLCIFSQMPLTDSDEVGALVYSMTRDGEGPMVWKYMCTEKKTDECAHIFDIDYLKIWVDTKGAAYCHCPVCRSGMSEERKEHVEEHDIDTMEQLMEKRDASRDDLPLRLFQEQLIVEKACATKWDRTHNLPRALLNERVLQSTLEHWAKVKKIDEFRPKIIENIKTAMNKDMDKIVRIMLDMCGYSSRSISACDDRNHELVDLINHACAKQSTDCLRMIFEEHRLSKLDHGIRPQSLLFAIKTRNTLLVDLVLGFLAGQGSRFVADECFEAAIKFDLLEAAQKILEFRWHSPTDDDYALAERCDNTVNAWLQKRKQPLIRSQDSSVLGWDTWDAEAEDGAAADGGGDDWDDEDDGDDGW